MSAHRGRMAPPQQMPQQAPQPVAEHLPVLEVRDLQTRFPTAAGTVTPVDGVSFTLARGEIMGLVGESGSGKSVTGLSIMGLIDKPGRITGGSIKLKGRELVGLPEKALRAMRGVDIAMIFQDPMMTLNPVLRVATQMTEAILVHERVSKQQALDRARAALVKVGIAAPDERLQAYPHALSGGMRQRIAIATALLHKPALIIADEPTTALDVTIQGQILAEVQQLARQEGMAMIWITHDLSVVAGLADKICVMYAGRVAEYGTVDQVLDTPLHPYTAGLIASVPSHAQKGRALYQIPGMAPMLLALPPGCAFQARCPRADAQCRATPPPHSADHCSGHRAWCWHPAQALATQVSA
ncbi:ABC transporter ATP-binding protein [Verminephrobacter eiseniae]|nr:ABC transporter ATP-binding protein [Verminephrobacter eiseniae]